IARARVRGQRRLRSVPPAPDAHVCSTMTTAVTAPSDRTTAPGTSTTEKSPAGMPVTAKNVRNASSATPPPAQKSSTTAVQPSPTASGREARVRAATHASSATAAATGATQSGAKIAEYPAGGGPVHRRSPTSKVVAAEPAATAARTAEGAGEGEVPVVSVMVTRLVTGAGRARRPQV